MSMTMSFPMSHREKCIEHIIWCLQVEVDIGISAHANARRWFEQKKKHAIKQDKTKAAHEKAFKAAEKKTLQQLAQVLS